MLLSSVHRQPKKHGKTLSILRLMRGARTLPLSNQITITDAGTGIATHLQTRVFDPFYSTKSLGQGLGLSSAQGFILQNVGAILLESQVGKGTTVSVLIPVK